ncbi:UNVERIFIED_CONTAM: hypothetical protein Sradi_7030500 [Sesamum radiatum]|uniref:Uncharacterized protein n=1 Tax=Sesamum radiatum TaxID=300843 RepID=A0AAW2JCG7_SESRA
MHKLSVIGACGSNLPATKRRNLAPPITIFVQKSSGHKDPKQHDGNNRNAAQCLILSLLAQPQFVINSRDSVLDKGDFNAVMDDSEVCGRAADTSISMTEFRTCVRDAGLVQLPSTGCPFTWHNCSEGPRKPVEEVGQNAC